MVEADSIELLKALHFAADKHRDQRRKNVEASPYINHPIEVAELLARVGPAERTSMRVQDVAVPIGRVGTATPDESVLAVAHRLATGPVPVLFVFDAGALIGMVTPEDLRRAQSEEQAATPAR